MKAVLIGTSDRSSLWRHGIIKKENYEEFVQEYARFLAKEFENVIVTPDDGVYTDVALEFGKLKGKKPVGYYPDKDTYYGYEHLKKNFSKYELKPIHGDWYKLNAELTKQAKIVICIGIGTMIEGSYIKYHQKYGKYKNPELKNIHWLIDKRCINQKLPTIYEEEIKNIYYYSNIEELGELLSALSKDL